MDFNYLLDGPDIYGSIRGLINYEIFCAGKKLYSYLGRMMHGRAVCLFWPQSRVMHHVLAPFSTKSKFRAPGIGRAAMKMKHRSITCLDLLQP